MPVAKKLNWPDAANITETLEQATEAFPHYTMLKMLNDEGRIIGMVRGKVENGSLYIGKLMVLPEYHVDSRIIDITLYSFPITLYIYIKST